MSPVSSVGAPAVAQTDPEARLQEAARALEGVFLRYMFQAMRETVPEGGLFDSSAGQEMFESMMGDHLADTMASRSEGGLGDMLYEQLRHRLNILPPSVEP